MTTKDLAVMIDDLDSRFTCVLANMDAVRRMLQDSGTAILRSIATPCMQRKCCLNQSATS